MKDQLKNSLALRFKDIYSKDHFTVATFLDPRFKNNFFKNDQEYICDNVFEILATQIKESIPDDEDQEPSERLEVLDEIDSSNSDEDDQPLIKFARTSTPASTDAHDLFWKTYEEFAGEGTSSDEVTKTLDMEPSSKLSIFEKLKVEIENFQKLPIMPRKTNPILWWKEKRDILPMLYSQAVIYLSAPAGSVASEQMFSEAGTVSSTKRNRLNPDTTERLIFLHDNLPKLNYSYY